MHNYDGSGPHGCNKDFGFGSFDKESRKASFRKHMHHGVSHMSAMRARRGDVRNAVLRLIAEAPMHGYQIIQELSKRSEGAWSPSAGSVYPTLQLLTDEGLLTAVEADGKKVYSLTDVGTEEVAKMADEPAPWEPTTETGTDVASVRRAAGKMMQALMQVGRNGTAKQLEAAIVVLDETRKKLYTIIAED